MKIVLASHNKNKLRELSALLLPALPDAELVLPSDVGLADEIEETGTTFRENALQKARAVSRMGYVAIADDSGICVDALDGAPGVYSARFSGGSDEDNNDLILSRLAGVKEEKRGARYVCCMVCTVPGTDRFLAVEDFCAGKILTRREGSGGFGYDPIFRSDDLGMSFGLASPEEKNRVSHRGKAVRRFAAQLPDFLRPTGEGLDFIRESLPLYIHGKRLLHTYAVEREAVSLARVFSMPEAETFSLRLAALLHDITKQKSTEEQLVLCARFGIPYGETETAAPKTFHALTGAALAKADFPALVTDDIALAIRSHTVGREGMTLPEKLIFLADYIEDTRTFEDCVALRDLFYRELPEGASERLRHLDRVLVTAFDMTIRDLTEKGAVISPQTVAARNSLLLGTGKEN